MRELPGGARWTPEATAFALRAPKARSVRLELEGSRSRSYDLHRDPDGVWRVEVPGLAPGARYAYRVGGPWAPAEGCRFNAAKLLVDPWALAVTGEPRWGPELRATARPGEPDRLLDGRDDAHLMPRCLVVDRAFDWTGEERRAPRPWSETVLYEAHVRGLTMRQPEVEPELRGTFLGLAHPRMVEHFLALGISAVELLPIQQFASEIHLLEAGRSNYWGYSPLAWLAPHAGYATGSDGRGDGQSDGRQVRECKEMIRRLHAAGLEVVLDIVLNHTAEGGLGDLRLSWQGIDPTLYRRRRGPSARLVDFTGCGNTVDPRTVVAREHLLAVLRYWIEDFHVDGFRLDLAPVLGRDPGVAFDPASSWFFRALETDPVLSSVKWIAEPWDLGPDGYCRGRFPAQVREWDDRFRDDCRRFWLFAAGAPAMAQHLVGPADSGGTADHWIHYVASHDGNTLLDVVSYDHKHNEANGEGNRDGHDGEIRSNHGVEGPTDDPMIRERRRRARRNLLATVALAPGVPMIAHGDEIGRTQLGNNNAYCQDSPLTWMDWDAVDPTWLERVRRAFAVRPKGGGIRRLLDPAGRSIPPEQAGPAFALVLPGEHLLLVNATSSPVDFEPSLVADADVLLATEDDPPTTAGRLPGPGFCFLRRPVAGRGRPARPQRRRPER